MHSGARADIDDVIGVEHRFFVMFHHQERIPQITQFLQRLEKFGIIALMQTDTWFIQNVQHSDQSGADLRRQPYPLGFAAGQRPGRPVE